MRSTKTTFNLGGYVVFAWGIVTAGLAIMFVGLMISAIPYMGDKGDFVESPRIPHWLMKTYFVVKDNNSLIAGITGFSALAWAYSFQEWMKRAGSPVGWFSISAGIFVVLAIFVATGFMVWAAWPH